MILPNLRSLFNIIINGILKLTEIASNLDNLFLMESIMNDMRKDLGLKRVKKGNLLGFFINDIKIVLNGK